MGASTGAGTALPGELPSSLPILVGFVLLGLLFYV